MDMMPRAAGEILSDAVALMRRNLRAIFLVALPFCVLELLTREGGSTLLAVARKGIDAGTLEELKGALPAFAGGLAFWLGMSVVLQLLVCAITTLTAGAALGQTLSPSQAFASVQKKLGAIVWTTFLFTALLFIVTFILPALPAALLALVTLNPFLLIGVYLVVGVVSAVVLFFQWVMWPQVLMLEDKSGFAAMARSKVLMAAQTGARSSGIFGGAKFRLSLLMLVFFVASGALQGLFALPTLIVSKVTTGEATLPPLIDLPLWFIAPVVIVTVLTNSMVFPFNGVASTLFYFDLRVRNEGFGLLDDNDDDDDAAPESKAALDTSKGNPA